MSEYKKRRDKMLTYYPEVASVGDLATALSRALAQEGSSLTGYSPVPPEKPTWSIFSDHPDAKGTTVPEFARVKAAERACQVYIGWFELPLGKYRVEFFDSSDRDEIADLDCWVDTHDLVTTARIIRRAFDHDAEVSDLAHEYGQSFGRRPRSKEEEANRELSKMSEEDRERELERRSARAYEAIGLSEDYVSGILHELEFEQLAECLGLAQLDIRDHIRKRHPGEGLPWATGKILKRVLEKLHERRPDPDGWLGTGDPSGVRTILVTAVVRATASYWSHVTEGHRPPDGTAEEYLVSLAQGRRRGRRTRSR